MVRAVKRGRKARMDRVCKRRFWIEEEEEEGEKVMMMMMMKPMMMMPVMMMPVMLHTKVNMKVTRFDVWEKSFL
jgi:hypothetical protein